MQHWTGVIGSAQQMMLEYVSAQMAGAAESGRERAFAPPGAASIMKAQADFWSDSMILWQRFVTPGEPIDPEAQAKMDAVAAQADKDRRFAQPEWREAPLFDLIRQSYVLLSEHLLKGVDAVEGLDPKQREKIRFATRAFTDALSPSNFALTNPRVLARTIETGGANLLKGLEHMLADIGKGQLTQTDSSQFELGRNIAATPGKVVKETPLYQLIQYSPTTRTVNATPLIVFPPWINRFYILDLTPEKSFIRWAVGEGLTVFMVSWKSADATMIDTSMDDYVVRGQIDAIDTVRDLLDVESVHTIGYCVAGTALSAALALLATRGEAAKVASATFFTAQVDFADAGDLNLFIGDEQMALIGAIGGDSGVLDGRYMAATFNLLRGRDLIWSYVVNNYLMGEDYSPFDLLHWNSDVTNLPARWHRDYLDHLYRDNRLSRAGEYRIDGVPIDLSRVETPAYIQAGREDHIAPAHSVWKLTDHFRGPHRFVLAGSGHIAGVVNPPAANKYQYWTNDADAPTLESFIAGATEHKGSWWPDWRRWLDTLSAVTVPAECARIPGGGALPAIEDAPGRYVRTR
ncbi:MAG: class I poly(R)-hydroxyalkanoic acid synthase [Sphingomonas sp.]